MAQRELDLPHRVIGRLDERAATATTTSARPAASDNRRRQAAARGRPAAGRRARSGGRGLSTHLRPSASQERQTAPAQVRAKCPSSRPRRWPERPFRPVGAGVLSVRRGLHDRVHRLAPHEPFHRPQRRWWRRSCAPAPPRRAAASRPPAPRAADRARTLTPPLGDPLPHARPQQLLEPPALLIGAERVTSHRGTVHATLRSDVRTPALDHEVDHFGVLIEVVDDLIGGDRGRAETTQRGEGLRLARADAARQTDERRRGHTSSVAVSSGVGSSAGSRRRSGLVPRPQSRRPPRARSNPRPRRPRPRQRPPRRKPRRRRRCRLRPRRRSRRPACRRRRPRTGRARACPRGRRRRWSGVRRGST